jgi:hypothetical protein
MVLTMLCDSHGAVDDPDASIIYDEVTKLIVDKYPQYQKDIVVMRVPPSDQSQFLFFIYACSLIPDFRSSSA